MTVSSCDVIQSFQWILGRNPDRDSIEWHINNFQNTSDLRQHLLNTTEFSQLLAFLMKDTRDSFADFVALKLAFIHLPKTGGTSLVSVLRSAFGPDKIFPDQDMIGRHPANKLSRYQFFHGHFTRLEAAMIPGPVRMITILREPRARILSQYRFHRAHHVNTQSAREQADVLLRKSQLPLEQYLSDPDVRAHPAVNNLYSTSLFALVDCVPSDLKARATNQYETVGKVDPDVSVAVACAILDDMTWLSTTELLDQTMLTLASTLGLDLKITEPQRFMVTDHLSMESPNRYRSPESLSITSSVNHLLDELVGLDEIIYQHCASLCRRQTG